MFLTPHMRRIADQMQRIHFLTGYFPERHRPAEGGVSA